MTKFILLNHHLALNSTLPYDSLESSPEQHAQALCNIGDNFGIVVRLHPFGAVSCQPFGDYLPK